MRTIQVESVAVSPRHYIDGRRVSSAETLELHTPITNTPIGEIDNASAEIVDEAVAAASHAFPAWAARGPEGRQPILHRYAECIKAHTTGCLSRCRPYQL